MSPIVCPLATRAESDPDCVAVWIPEGPLTYKELESHIEYLALKLHDAGVRRGDRVAFVAARRWDDLVTFWAVWRLCAIACPISARFPQRQQQNLVEQLNAIPWSSGLCLDVPSLPPSALAAPQSDIPRFRNLELDIPATILFSSGTTNVPKAVVHTLSAHFENARGSATNIPLEPGDRWLASLPFYHVGGLAILVRTMLAGASVVIPVAGAPLTESIGDYRVTHCSIVATQLRQLVEASGNDLASLKCLLLGGGPCPHELLREAIGKGLPLRTTYGLTEMASQVTATTEDCGADRITTAGQVLPGRQLRIEHGEILVRGPTLCLGYDRSGTIEPVVDRDGWFHTGDAGSLDQEGFLTVAGRLDQLFISGGENIHPEAIEQYLLTLPGVRQAIVVPVDDREFGQRPVAYIDAVEFDPESWEQAMRVDLPSYMIPDAWFPWPDCAAGDVKISRRWLQEQANERRQT